MGRAPTGTIRRLASGRWQARFYDPDGVRHNAPRTFVTKRDATVYLAQITADISRGQYRPAVAATMAVTFADYSARWVDTRRVKGRALAPSTRENYRALLRDHLIPAFGSAALHKITRDDVDNWFDRPATAAHPTTRARAYSLLRTILNTAVDDEHLERNPCRIRGGSTAPRRHQPRAATPEEIGRLLGAIASPRHRLMVLLAVYTGVRFGELTELRRGDLELRGSTGGTLHIRRAVVLADGVFVVKEPKSEAGTRSVAIPAHLLPALRAHLIGGSAASELDGGLLFPSASDPRRHMRQGSLVKWFYPARRAAGLPTLRWHDLRHTSADWANRAGASPAELMARHGWSSVAVAMRYQHATAERDRELASRLAELAI